MKILIEKGNEGERLDVFLTKKINDMNIHISRSSVTSMLDICTVNGSIEKRGYRVKEGDVLDIDVERLKGLIEERDISGNIEGQKFDLDIRYEDEDVLVIYKPKGVVVHPGVGNRDNTIANYVRYYLESKNEYDNMLDRAGIVHRLDKGVSGLLVIAKNRRVQEYLKEEFKNHRVIKIYEADIEREKDSIELSEYIREYDTKEILKSISNGEEVWNKWYRAEGYIGRNHKDRYAMEFRRYEFGGSKYALSYILPSEKKALIKIETGRMHQIRVTLKYLGYHILGDDLYGNGDGNIHLESIYLSFVLPNGNRVSVIGI